MIGMPVDLPNGHWLDDETYKQLIKLSTLAFQLHNGDISERDIFDYINGEISNELYNKLQLESLIETHEKNKGELCQQNTEKQ
mgnify:CR=1 FL=1